MSPKKKLLHLSHITKKKTKQNRKTPQQKNKAKAKTKNRA